VTCWMRVETATQSDSRHHPEKLRTQNIKEKNK